MVIKNGMYNHYDLEAAKILNDFLPEQIFDVHAHLYDASFVSGMANGGGAFSIRNLCEVSHYLEDMKPLLGDREVNLNIVTTPDASMTQPDSPCRKAGVDFLADQLTRFPGHVGEVMVGPEDTVEDIEKMLIHPGIRGFKCYHLLAANKPTWNAPIGDYLPEAAWEVADKHGFVITLHMVRDQALSDPVNQEYIIRMAKKYPNAVLILAHAARSFAAWTAVEAVDAVKHVDNVWFDFSGVCESPAMFQIMRKCGIDRCMWGSDYPASMLRGRAVGVGKWQDWLVDEHFSGPERALIPVENLLAFYHAALLLNLDQTQVEDIFCNNAESLFGKE
jgi:glutamate-1-semialdehyde 2,1-aminomutase